MNTASPLLISVDQLADLLQISRRSVWRRLSAGELPEPVRIGCSVRWRVDEIRRWIEQGCTTPVESGKGE